MAAAFVTIPITLIIFAIGAWIADNIWWWKNDYSMDLIIANYDIGGIAKAQ